MLPKGLANPKHSVDFHPTVLDENEWRGKMMFKIPDESQRETLRDVVERVRETVAKETKPEIQETVNADRRRRKANSGTACAACLADSVGLCSVHSRYTTVVNTNCKGGDPRKLH